MMMVMLMNNGQRLGLVLLYVVMAGNAVLMLSIFVQILFRAIKRHGRSQFTERNGGVAYTLSRFDGERGWANTWLPRNPEINQPTQIGNSTGKLAGAAPIVKQAIAPVSILIGFGLPWPAAAQQRTSREVSDWTLKQRLLDLDLKETHKSNLDFINRRDRVVDDGRPVFCPGSVAKPRHSSQRTNDRVQLRTDR